MILVWILIISGWSFAMMVPFLYVLKLCGLLLISPEEEEVRFALACMTAKTLQEMLCQVHFDMHRQCMPWHEISPPYFQYQSQVARTRGSYIHAVSVCVETQSGC